MQKLTKDQAAIIGAYTGFCVGPFSDIHAYAEKILGRQIWTHEFPSIADELQEAAREDFVSLAPMNEED